ncbi:MAG: phosphohistidine phosphatase SixA [Cyanobacteriota bacterium]|jgi:phosphohistidine phosphatase|nr:phosphohistidine phosphatase SixA [Cyanobacteriota bacterium]
MSRELLLLRHGIAEDRGGSQPDGLRTLTVAGRARTRLVLDRLQRLDLGCDLLLTSPLVRARETAALALEAGLAPELRDLEALAPDGDARPALHDLLNDSWQRLGLVGHEPDLSLLASRLLGHDRPLLELRKAGVAVLRLDEEGQWTLRLLLSPRILLAG